jgi:hypothetical protein
LKEYENLKVENVLLDMCSQTLGVQVGKLGERRDEVQDMFKEDLQ